VREYIRQCVEGGRSTIKWIINDAVRHRIRAEQASRSQPKPFGKKATNPTSL
jgi:hypothetical protein